MKHKNKVKTCWVKNVQDVNSKYCFLFTLLWLHWTQTIEWSYAWHICSQSKQSPNPWIMWVMNHWPFMCETVLSAEVTKVQTDPLIRIYPSAPRYLTQMWACMEVMTVNKTYSHVIVHVRKIPRAEQLY